MFYNNLNVVLDIPYPNIDNFKGSKKLGYKLKKAYCGRVSELSCITKYIYEHIYLENDLKEIKEVSRKIAIVEMHHLDIIGNMIKKCGLPPIYTYLNKVDNETYWESSLISYEIVLPKFLEENIQDEKKAIKLYQELIKEADDEVVTDILNRIILDEENHIKIFQAILNNLI